MSGDRIVPRVFLARLWEGLGGDPARLEQVRITGPETVLPSVYDVTGFAAATIGAAMLAAAELRGDDGDVVVDRMQAAAVFSAEMLFTPSGWERVPAWDPIAGDHPAADGWVRLHTNYAAHRQAALWALGCEPADVASVVAARPAADIEADVVARGGAAAAMHDPGGWRRHRHGSVAVDQPIVFGHGAGAGQPRAGDGLRVLDLTRVIAGPECTRFLAAVGADVLRIDPPGFEEVSALLPETTAGKRCASLDVRLDADRFDALVRDADVLVCGLRPGALDVDRVRAVNPSIVIARLDAYGWAGPWSARRGFDSLVQMSTGIAARGQQVYGTDRPKPLPAQALDHGAGFALAAGVLRAMTELRTNGAVVDVFASLVGAANLLVDGGEVDDPDGAVLELPDSLFEAVTTAWGPARRVRQPMGTAAIAPGPLGRDDAVWHSP
jgi:hypothetical protein